MQDKSMTTFSQKALEKSVYRILLKLQLKNIEIRYRAFKVNGMTWNSL